MKKALIANQSGFSLIELMVTVGIIGVLATVAVPQYSKFTNRAKQSEVKSLLGGIYTVEKASFVETNTYTTCLAAIGFSAEGNKRNYSVGFGKATVRTVPNAADCSANDTAANNVHFFQNSVGTAKTPVNTNDVPTGGASFIAGGVGAIGGAADDVWNINQLQALNNPTSGI